MNPLTVRLYDASERCIVTHFLDMGAYKRFVHHTLTCGCMLFIIYKVQMLFVHFCCHIGTQSATAASIFEKMDCVFQENKILWSSCVGVSVDNTSVNLGRRNSIMTWALQKKILHCILWAAHVILFTIIV